MQIINRRALIILGKCSGREGATVPEILDSWPDDVNKPTKPTVYSFLNQQVEEGNVEQYKGRRGSYPQKMRIYRTVINNISIQFAGRKAILNINGKRNVYR